MACFSGFLTGREAATVMAPRGRGTIIFTGATASIRGAPNFAAFSVAKSGLRSLAQSMARELGPQGIHVAHVVVDGAVDTPWVRENFADHIRKMPPDGKKFNRMEISFFSIYFKIKSIFLMYTYPRSSHHAK